MQTIQLGCQTYTKAQAIAIMQHPTSGDMTWQLASQLIAAKLNISCSNSNPTCVSSAIAAANSFLCAHPIGSGVPASSSAWQQFKPNYDTIVAYNMGQLCAPSAGNLSGSTLTRPPATLSTLKRQANY